MATQKEISEYFQGFAMCPNTEILDKCVELCNKYKLDAETFVDVFLAFSSTHLDGSHPTISALVHLEETELKVLKKRQKYVAPLEISQQIIGPNTSIKQTAHCNVIYTYGDKNSKFYYKPTNVQVQVLNNINGNDSQLYMCDQMLKKKEIINELTNLLSSQILNNKPLKLSEASLKHHTGKIVIAGRVYSETPNEKLTCNTVILEGTEERNNGKTANLKLKYLEKFGLFPGQVVVVEGEHLKDSIIASAIHSLVPLKMPDNCPSFDENLQILVAAGPFTADDNLNYEPLNNLVGYLKENRVNILILLGPFLDSSHKDFEKQTATYEFFFQNLIEDLIEQLKDFNIEIVLVPSPLDIHSSGVFPTFPLELEKCHPMPKMAPSPCNLEIGHLKIGISTVDILYHLSTEEITKDINNLKAIERVVRYILGQKSFYPLYPPKEEVYLDHNLLQKYGQLDAVPHLLILPSDLNFFVQNVAGCLTINPGKLSKPGSKGSFARLEIVKGTKPMFQRINVQILEM